MYHIACGSTPPWPHVARLHKSQHCNTHLVKYHNKSAQLFHSHSFLYKIWLAKNGHQTDVLVRYRTHIHRTAHVSRTRYGGSVAVVVYSHLVQSSPVWAHGVRGARVRWHVIMVIKQWRTSSQRRRRAVERRVRMLQARCTWTIKRVLVVRRVQVSCVSIVRYVYAYVHNLQ